MSLSNLLMLCGMYKESESSIPAHDE